MAGIRLPLFSLPKSQRIYIIGIEEVGGGHIKKLYGMSELKTLESLGENYRGGNPRLVLSPIFPHQKINIDPPPCPILGPSLFLTTLYRCNEIH
jgi:hypothetical protein